jgi:hypothetical protein
VELTQDTITAHTVAVGNASTQELLDNHPDYIKLPRFNNSLKEFEARYPNGVEGDRGIKLISRALEMTPEDVQLTLEHIIYKLRIAMKVDQ